MRLGPQDRTGILFFRKMERMRELAMPVSFARDADDSPAIYREIMVGSSAIIEGGRPVFAMGFEKYLYYIKLLDCNQSGGNKQC